MQWNKGKVHNTNLQSTSAFFYCISR